jgi:hypothetical protein
MIKKHTFYYLSEVEEAIKDTVFYRSVSWQHVFYYFKEGDILSLKQVEDDLLTLKLNPLISYQLEMIRYLYSLGIDKEEALIYVDM